MPMIITSTARGPQGPEGPPGSSDATKLLGIPLAPNISTPQDGYVIGFNADTGKWESYSLDIGTF